VGGVPLRSEGEHHGGRAANLLLSRSQLVGGVHRFHRDLRRQRRLPVEGQASLRPRGPRVDGNRRGLHHHRARYRTHLGEVRLGSFLDLGPEAHDRSRSLAHVRRLHDAEAIRSRGPQAGDAFGGGRDHRLRGRSRGLSRDPPLEDPAPPTGHPRRRILRTPSADVPSSHDGPRRVPLPLFVAHGQTPRRRIHA